MCKVNFWQILQNKSVFVKIDLPLNDRDPAEYDIVERTHVHKVLREYRNETDIETFPSRRDKVLSFYDYTAGSWILLPRIGKCSYRRGIQRPRHVRTSLNASGLYKCKGHKSRNKICGKRESHRCKAI